MNGRTVQLAPRPVVLADRYELCERIGRGGIGDVYRARDIGGPLAREVCIKRLGGHQPPRSGGGGDPRTSELVGTMLEEARLLASVRHANVVSLLDVGEERGGLPFLVLELIDGPNLCTLSRAIAAAPPAARFEHRGVMPDAVAVHVACAVLRALSAAQRALPGLVHRDVTPHNILVSRAGEVKLADFGIALAPSERPSARWTRPCVVKGKIGYIAPEHIRGDDLDPRADLFAVGVLLFELLARVRPWGAARGVQEARAIARGERLSLSDFRPDLDAGLVAMVHRLLADRPADRFAIADDALRALSPWSAGDLGSLRIASILDRLGKNSGGGTALG